MNYPSELQKTSNKIVGYVNIENLANIYNSNKHLLYNDDFVNNYNTIRNNPEQYELFKILVKELENRSTQKIIQKGGVDLIIPLVFFSVSSSLLITSSVAFILYKIFTKATCRDKYPIYPLDKVPTFKEIVLTLTPKYIIPNVESLDLDTFFVKIDEYIAILGGPMSIIAPESTVSKYLGDIVEIIAGVGLTSLNVASAGVTTALGYLVKFFNFAKEAIGLLYKLFQALNDLSKIVNDSESLHVLYDVFNINFKDGPFGTRCWVDYILNSYAKGTDIFKKTCSLFNKISDKIFDKLIKFLAKALTFSIPDAGISGVLFAGILSLLKSRTYDYLLTKMNQAYDKMSYDSQLMFENPKIMKETIENYLKKSEKFIRKLGDNVYEILYNNVEFVAFTINKLFAFIFSMFYVFSICSKI